MPLAAKPRTGRVRASLEASQGVYGAPRVFLDLRKAGETCSKHRVARLMRVTNLRALHGYRTWRWAVGEPSVLIPNLLKWQFTVTRPYKAWVTDITYIQTWQAWLSLAVRPRHPCDTLVHSNGGPQFGSEAW